MMIICIAAISLGLTTIDQVDTNIQQFVKCVQFSVLLKFNLICIHNIINVFQITPKLSDILETRSGYKSTIYIFIHQKENVIIK